MEQADRLRSLVERMSAGPAAVVALDAQEASRAGAMPEPILQFFAYSHLPAPLAATSALFSHLAHILVRELPRNPERSVALRKLLEAKDAAVRAALYRP